MLDVPYPKKPPLRAEEAARKAFDHFVENNKLARSTLLTFMEPDLEVIYEEYKTPKEMFDAVTEAYGTASNTYIQLLIEKYNGIVMKEGGSVVNHVNKLLVIAKELATLGKTVLKIKMEKISSLKKDPRDIVCVVSESLLADCDTRSWWVDSASSRHVAKTKENFVEMRDVNAGDHKLYMGNNTYCDVLGVGTVKILLPGQNNLILTDVLYAPNMKGNLLSVPLG
ncbi:hypothetical protein RJ639_001582 [Escallonia herrerae]|uniref:Retrovirus-related Pol polyprotein from transposon TNT 1-94-like beta-barrel domain-containing protein n=1 Tax=Escallonia herrerae TaxID=1293975 RepID=A0AA89BF38_9ASTE|nr:hypothetical protein RJ639_001582 [Escallonia herrerae]